MTTNKLKIVAFALVGILGAGCGDDDEDGNTGGTGGTATGGTGGTSTGGTGGTSTGGTGGGGRGGTGGTSTGGSGGMAGMGGTGGTSTGGSGGMAGMGGSGGMAGMGGTGGAGGATGMARGANNPPMLGAQIDRAGRPAISTALIETFNADENAKKAGKEAYNMAEPAMWSTFVPRIRGNLAILDALDGKCGNQLVADQMGMARYTFLATVLADDQLYVNSASGKCGIYLGLEAELVVPGLPAEVKGSCGGRSPGEDVIERSYSVLAAGVLAGVDDTVTKDDAMHDVNTFPFLAAPK